jgi:TRAP-type mannitol/chloroaromatic compound transport system permease small subunit
MTARSTPFGFLTTLMNAIGTIMVLFIMAVILVDIVGRGLFKHPLSGATEIVAMSIAAIVFLQFPSTLRAGRVIATDGFLEWVHARSVRAEQFLLSAYHLLGGILFAVVAAYVAPQAVSVWEGREFYGNIGVFIFPKWPVFATIAFGSAVMALQYFILAWQFVGAGIERRRLIEIDPANKVMS